MKQPDNFDFVQLNRKHPEILVSWAGQALVDRCRMTDVFEYVIMYYGTPGSAHGQNFWHHHV